MKTLHLTLKKKWFDMIASGEKKEEYREIKPYWLKRLMDYLSDDGYELNQGELEEACCDILQSDQSSSDFTQHVEYQLENWHLEFKHYDRVQFRNGYAKNAPTMTVECKGIEIGEGKPEWGAEIGKKYFVNKLGNVLSIER